MSDQELPRSSSKETQSGGEVQDEVMPRKTGNLRGQNMYMSSEEPREEPDRADSTVGAGGKAGKKGGTKMDKIKPRFKGN